MFTEGGEESQMVLERRRAHALDRLAVSEPIG
jgi:hypothetical protein